MTATAILATTIMEASQSQKEVTFNDEVDVHEKAIGGALSVSISTTTPVVLSQTTQSARAFRFTLDNAGSPPIADFVLQFPTVARGLVFIKNRTAKIATIKISGQASPPTLAAGASAVYEVSAADGVILVTGTGIVTPIPLSYLDTDGALAANSDVKVASQKATKTYADLKIPLTYLDTDTALAANSDAKIATQKATKAYADAILTSANSHTVKDNATSTYTAGQKGTGTSLGTKSSGTLTPTIDASNMNLQYVTNGGAFILAAPSTAGDYTIILDITNNGSAGSITYSGWTKNPSGDTLDTTNAHAFRFFITKINGVTSATIQALQ